MKVASTGLALLWCILESYGIDPERVIDREHYSPRGGASLPKRISFEVFDAYQVAADRLIGDPAWGLRSGCFILPSHYGALGHAWIASSTLRMALRRGERFAAMLNENSSSYLDERSGMLRLVVGARKKPSLPGSAFDMQMSNILAMCRYNFGRELQPLRVSLKRAAPADPGPWLDTFGDAVRFGQAVNAIDFSAKDADRPSVGGDADMVTLHDEIILRDLSRMDRENVLERARLIIVEQLASGRITEDDLADAMSMSKRTLHRKLRENGETFRSLLTDVRKDLAARYTRSGDYSVTEVAFLLGYGDASSFSRAYRGWFGHSPSRARSLRVVA